MAELDFTDNPWPPAEFFPLNTTEGKVLPWAKQELDKGPALVVTGFSSLEFLVQQLSTLGHQHLTRVLIGQEPVLRKEHTWSRPPTLKEEMKSWWLEQGFSLASSGPVYDLLKRIDDGLVQFRLSDQLHAKIVLGQEAVLLGSSNFSQSGMKFLKEANIRKTRQAWEYAEIARIAENFWEECADSTELIRGLLLELLNKTSWQEALGLAGYLLLEGDWMLSVPELAKRFQSLPLWESQKQALSQAFYMLDNFGDGLLVADPTGSGKTRLGAGLHFLLLLRLFAMGHSDRTRTIIVTPPQVKAGWEREFAALDANQPEVVSQGLLSRGKNPEGPSISDNLKGCRVLFLDEAHNYLNAKSNRSTVLLGHGADHTVLFTATPINRKTEDLFRILNLLGPDNLSDEALKTFDSWGNRKRLQAENDLEEIRKQISLFTIRRTKADLNLFISRNPAGYTRKKILSDGRVADVPCRYPRTQSKTYVMGETPKDIELAERIDEISWKLKGLIYLRQLTATPEDLRTEENQQRFLEGRIKAAAALAAWNIKATLRSSRAALIEHILGTEEACRFAGVPPFGKDSGNIKGTLHKNGFPIPKNRLTIPLPSWMTILEEREKSLQQEIETYEEIAELARMISNKREAAKVDLLLRLVNEHSRVLAFDSRILTLEMINTEIRKVAPHLEPLVVTGGRKEEQRDARRVFGLDSEHEGKMGLCSDAMAEGVNLQGARCLVLLDMPSVMRLAEQRIGRIDRMNSPYESIQVWWPEDHLAFALKTDRRFFLTADSVKQILGSNIEIPHELTNPARLPAINGSTAIQLWEDNAKQADEDRAWGVKDAFADLKSLYWGKDSLVPSEIYKQLPLKNFKTAFAVVPSPKPWALLVADEGKNAPRWTLWAEGNILINLGDIAEFLRTVLPPPVTTIVSTLSESHIVRVCREVEKNELYLLPHKKRRALRTLARLVQFWNHQGLLPKEARASFLTWANTILPAGDLYSEAAVEASRYQLGEMARLWLEIADPALVQLRENWRKRRFLSWNSREVFVHLKSQPLATEQWEELSRKLVLRPPLENRIRVALWGLPTG